MSDIIRVNAKSLIIKRENSTLFINKDNDNLHIKEEFITTDGYEVGLDYLLNKEELEAIGEILK